MKPKPVTLAPKVEVEIIRCYGCGSFGVSIDDTRITPHKCAGHWRRIEGHMVAPSAIERALAESPAFHPRPRKGRR